MAECRVTPPKTGQTPKTFKEITLNKINDLAQFCSSKPKNGRPKMARRSQYEAPIDPESVNPLKPVPTSVTMPSYYRDTLDKVLELEFDLACMQNKRATLTMSRSAFIIDMLECGLYSWLVWLSMVDPKDAKQEELVNRAVDLFKNMPPHLREKCEAALQRHFRGFNMDGGQPIMDLVQQCHELNPPSHLKTK